jgi:hypothetical protein
MCTLWYVFVVSVLQRKDRRHVFVRCIEALTRAGQTDRQLLPKAVSMFEVGYREHLFESSDGKCLRTFYSISIMSDFAPKKYPKLEKRTFLSPLLVDFFISNLLFLKFGQRRAGIHVSFKFFEHCLLT